MKLRRLTLKDFQTHDVLDLKLDPSVTVLTGPTDAGKSAVLRALRWLCLNDLTGDDFVRVGAKRTVVTLHARDKKSAHVIARIRGGSINAYALNESEFKAFGQGRVPEDIGKLLRLSEINFQGQHDSPFWFHESASEVSRRLNAVVDLSIIDVALSNISQGVRRAADRKEFFLERVGGLKKELEDLSPQKERIEDFKRLKLWWCRFESCKGEINTLKTLLGQTSDHQTMIESRKEKTKDGGRLLTLGREALNYQSECEKLSDLIRRGGNWQETAAAPPSFLPVEEAFEDWKRIHVQFDSLDFLLGRILEITEQEFSARQRLSEAEQKFHQRIQGQKCPLCGEVIQL